jgi:hypothetical protein
VEERKTQLRYVELPVERAQREDGCSTTGRQDEL